MPATWKSRTICSVLGCASHADSETSLHCFPLSKKLKKAWVIRCRMGKKITKNFRVCSKHFAPADFKLFTSRNVPGKKKMLINGAIPSQNLPKASFAKPQKISTRSSRLKQIQPVTDDASAKPISAEGSKINVTSDQSVTNTVADIVEEMETDATFEHNLIKTVDREVQVNTFNESNLIKTSPILQIISNENSLNAWTGIPTFLLLTAIEDCVKVVTDESDIGKGRLTLTEKVLLVFVKLKSNMSFVMMAGVFNVSATTVSRVFASMVSVLSCCLRPILVFQTMDMIRCNMPICFKKHFSDVRAILDCSEVSIQLPNCTNCRIATYSHYKGTHTAKFLVCITPSGTISYVSKAYTGKCSDKQIFNDEGLVRKFNENDAIMVDKGFAIENELRQKNIKLIRPSFSKGAGIQFEKDEQDINTKIASARVHVERTIQRMKIFSILCDKIDHNLLSYLNEILEIIASVVNLSNAILADDKF